jgi:hypothetical protein
LAPLAFLTWTVFAATALVLPGVALQRMARIPVDPALVLPLGGAFTAGAWWASLATGQHWLFPVLLALLVAGLAFPRTPWRRAEGPSLRGALPPLVAAAVLLAFTHYGWNRVGPSGDFLLDPLVTFDSTFHVGVTYELVTGYPPQVPGVAGFPLGYHLGTDLVRAAALRWAATSPWDSLTRLDVTLWALALILAIRAVVARLGAPPAAVALAPWTLLLTDFSFLFATNLQAHWWTDLLRGNLLLSFVYANPIVPALALTLGSLVALSRYEDGQRRGHLALAALLAAAVPFFKVFLGAHLLLGLGLAFLLARPAPRRALVAIATPAALATAALVLGPGGETVSVVLAPLDLARVTRETLGLAPVHGLGLLRWAAFWILASLGMRLLGLGHALRALRGPGATSALAGVALTGWPLGLLFRVSAPEVLEGQKTVNDAAYLVEQSGPVLWLFTAVALVGFATTPIRRILAAVALVSLATPSTFQYALKKASWPPARLPAPMVRAMEALVPASEPGDVVLQRPAARYPPAPVVLAGRRVPYDRFTPYLTQFATREALEARHLQVYRFFRSRDREGALAIARSLGARFLALYGHDRVRFDTSGVLEPLYEEPGARLYRILYETASPPTPDGSARMRPRSADEDEVGMESGLYGGSAGAARGSGHGQGQKLPRLVQDAHPRGPALGKAVRKRLRPQVPSVTDHLPSRSPHTHRRELGEERPQGHNAVPTFPDRVAGDRLRQVEGPRPGAPQGLEVATHPQVLPQIPGQCPDVGPRRAAHLDLHLPVPEPKEIDGVNGDPSRGPRDGLAATREVVQPPSLHSPGRVGRGHLIPDPHQPVQGAPQRPFVHAPQPRLGQGLPGEVVGGRGEPQPDGPPVHLLPLPQEPGQTRRPAQAQGQDAGGEGVQGTRVSHPAEAEGPAGAVHHVVGRGPGGLVDDQHPLHVPTPRVRRLLPRTRRPLGPRPRPGPAPPGPWPRGLGRSGSRSRD